MTFAKKIKNLNTTTLESFSRTSEREIVKKFTEAGVKIFGASYGFAWFKNDDRSFELKYKSPGMPYNPAVPRKNGSNYRVMKTGKALLINNLPKNKFIRGDAQPHVKSLAILPISYKKHIYGSIYICFENGYKFSEEDKILCTFIGNSTAQAVTIRRFHMQLEDLVTKRTKQLKKINVKLRGDKASDEAVLSSIGEGLVGTNKDGKIIFINPAAENMLKTREIGIMGKSIYEVQPLFDAQNRPVPPDKTPTFLALTQGKKISVSNYCHGTSQKNLTPVAITATPIFLGGKIIGSIQVFRDITEEREVDRVKTELISLASHQLRTPLSAINWYTEALVKQELGPLNPGQKKYLGQIRSANQKMIRMVYDFLNVSRIEMGTFTVKLSRLDVRELTKGTIEEIRPLLREKQLKVRECYGRGLGIIEADQKILRVILQNLITNAVKYTPSGGKIEIRLDLPRPGLLRLVVKDNGHGIPKQQQSKIFSKLFRADNAAKLDTEGSGLGLYLVKSFIDLCRGRISFVSRENQGTAFTVTLPVKHSV